VTDADLAVCYQRATVVVVPSRAEGFGLPVIEAMAAGAPVVATAIPALTEVAGGAARLVEPDPETLAAGIVELLEEPGLRSELISRGLRRAADFDWEVSAHRLWRLYLEVAQGQPAVGGA
jgi:glycosyltransferase involved in cell wall biosynthesis